jgi:hypothetical protein
MPLNPKFACSVLAKDNGFLRAMKICSTHFLWRGRRSHVIDLQLVKEPYKA